MTPRTKREYLRERVADKNRWARPLTDEQRPLLFSGFVQAVSMIGGGDAVGDGLVGDD